MGSTYKKAFVSFSGGKDSVLAFYNAIKHHKIKVAYLLNMLSEDGIHSRSHHLYVSTLKTQAEAIGIPILQRKARWEDYEGEFKKVLADFKKLGVNFGIFGDIDVEEHKDWVERVCRENGLHPILPLWKRQRLSLMEEFITCGFKAIIVGVKCDCMGKEWLGRKLDKQFVEDMKSLPDVDLCGENGEYHTFVYDGPIFKKPVGFIMGKKTLKDKRYFLEIIVNT